MTVCRPDELGDAELTSWRRMQRETPGLGHPFLTAEFAQAVGSATRDARVAVIEDGAETVGFFAHHRNRVGVARPIGGRLNYRQGLVHTAGFDWSWPELMHAAGLHAMAFTDLMGQQAATGGGLAAGSAPIIDTSVGWDTYITGARRHSQIRKTMQHARRLEREFGPVEFTWGPAPADKFARLIAWKSQQYRSSGWPDPFARRWIRTTLEVLVAHGDGDLKPVFTTLRAGGEVLAADLSLQYGDVLALWFSSYDPAYGGYSPGAIRRLRTVEQACAEHLAYVDFARGEEPYKQLYKNADLPVATGLVYDHSVPAMMYRSIRNPYTATRSWVLRRPRVRAFVRSSLRHAGSLRVRLQPHGLRAHPS